MLKQTITFEDYNGVTRTEDHYFNLNKAELMELQLSVNGGLDEMIKKIVNSKDTPSIIKIFKTIIMKAYGVKSDDGRRFIKSETISEEFTQTEAYSQLFMDLISDADKAAAFINSVVPADLAEKVKEADLKALPNA